MKKYFYDICVCYKTRAMDVTPATLPQPSHLRATLGVLPALGPSVLQNRGNHYPESCLSFPYLKKGLPICVYIP